MKLSDLVFETLNVFEDLGNLNVIDKQFLKPFMSRSGVKKVPHRDPELGYTYKDRGGKLAKPGIGANSVIDTVTSQHFKNAKDALEVIKVAGNVGGVIRFGDKQVIGISFEKPYDYKDTKIVRLTVPGDVLKATIGETDMYDKLNKKFYIKNDAVASFVVSASNASTIINAMMKSAKANGEDITMLVIGKDKDREQKGAERQQSRRGSQPVLTGDYNKNDKLAHAARNALRSRLDKFKGSNAKKFDTPMEALEELKKSGFADKIVVNGIVYDLQDEQIRLSVLKGKDSWNKFAYVVYKRNDRDRRYDELRDKIWDYKQKNPNDTATVEKMTSMLPPREIKYVLGFDGASIVPTGQIEFSENNW